MITVNTMEDNKVRVSTVGSTHSRAQRYGFNARMFGRAHVERLNAELRFGICDGGPAK